MIRAGPVPVWLATAPVDRRRRFDGLAEQVRMFLGPDPLRGSRFVFRDRSAQRWKLLWGDPEGRALYYKRLEKGPFQFPAGAAAEKVLAIDSASLLRLLRGLTLATSR